MFTGIREYPEQLLHKEILVGELVVLRAGIALVQWHHDARRHIDEVSPLLHQPAAALVGLGAALVSLDDGVREFVCERHFNNVIRIICPRGCPLPER